ncbi:homoserine O-succinyltransferase [Limosilactobacillus sp. STM2_1]|uniref:Serine O-acetyltransferase n=1 Tax=Limosilactobacillus rudii TaxID=2759755 RepID=A0A7W3YNE3_9LACO|nr:homoserine O-succinyltransferase [Limosilactobacillus rudii]MBB1079350.1 homoserine O-succinyltransferase [Limosilactobacillus rudii]MBB1097396.1 homoserine O-succinyltransferase [Limosilactobacillus rudii]MCD7134505.1 homoserine O-succinyltransferase [Limosilactobacillus rudii]
MNSTPLNIGILNLMHDKVDTQRRFSTVLKAGSFNVNIQYLYPQTHYSTRPVPELVQQISAPLNLRKVQDFDAFIITGAPVEQIPFTEITYINEVHQLIDKLVKLDIPQLYICWGAMAAANYLYDIPKHQLSEKIFGVFHNYFEHNDPLLAGLPNGFLAPHARYAELDLAKITNDHRLIVNAVTESNHLFSFRTRDAKQYFLFSHLEYGRDALLKEYLRERNAHPGVEYLKPQNYFRDPLHMKDPKFSWEATQRIFFDNWLHTVAKDVEEKQLIKE